MNHSILIKGLLTGVTISLLTGCVEREVVYEPAPVAPPPSAGSTVVVTDPGAPPPAQVEVIPAQPAPAFIWVAGAWEWEGHWVWVPGRWMAPPYHGAVWVHGAWVHHGHHYVWVRGYWH